MQRRERVENSHLDRLLEPHAQMIGMALALDCGAHPRQQFVAVNRAHDIVVHRFTLASTSLTTRTRAVMTC